VHRVFTQAFHRSLGLLLDRLHHEIPQLRGLASASGCLLVLAGLPAAGQSAAPNPAPAAAGDTTHVTASGMAAGVPAAGSYTYTLAPDSSDDIKAAINTTVSPMNFIVRGIARGRLTKVNPLPHTLRLRLATDTVSVGFDNGDPVVTPSDGAVVPWYNALAKETDKAHVAVAGDTVRQTISASDGDRQNAISFSDGGARLHLLVTVTSHRLPKPLVYQLLFRRDSAG
jgi:hypothetical protein